VPKPPPLTNNRTLSNDLWAPTGAVDNAATDQAALPTNDQAVKPAKERKVIHPAKTYRIEPTVAARLKAWAAINKRTEQDIVEGLIRDFLERIGG
jgi:hypothetical protein